MDIVRSSGHIGGPGRVRRLAALLAILLTSGLLPALIEPAQAAVTTRYVGPVSSGDGGSCDAPGFNAIQAAINASLDGDTVQVAVETRRVRGSNF